MGVRIDNEQGTQSILGHPKVPRTRKRRVHGTLQDGRQELEGRAANPNAQVCHRRGHNTKGSLTGLYNDHRGILIERVSTFHQIVGLEFDELLSIGHTEFMDAADTWDPKRARFSTWFYRNLTSRFINESVRNWTRAQIFVECSNYHSSTKITPSTLLSIREIVIGLSDEARNVIEIVLSGPTEILDEIDGTGIRQVRSALRRWCQERGMGRGKIDKTMKEIRQAVEVL